MAERRTTFGVVHLVITSIILILPVIRECFQCSPNEIPNFFCSSRGVICFDRQLFLLSLIAVGLLLSLISYEARYRIHFTSLTKGNIYYL
jgi:hypothetical protein